MNDTLPLVTLITVNYRTPHFIRHLLAGVEDVALAFPYEYILVDNGSRDGTVDMVRSRFPWVRVIDAGVNHGFGKANNIGIREGRGRYFLLCNPDLTFLPGELEKWIAWMDAHPEIGISGPRLMNPDGTDQDSCYRFPGLWTPIFRRTPLGKTPWGKRHNERYLMRGMDRTQEQDVDWVLGASMLIRREVIDKIGAFDERFFMYFEDADLCRRAWHSGFRVAFTPVARVLHYHQRQSQTRHVWEALKNPVARIHLVSGVKYFLKHFGTPDPRLSHAQQHPKLPDAASRP